MERIGRVTQGGTTINFSSYPKSQQTTSPIRNIVDSVHAAEHLGKSLCLILQFLALDYTIIDVIKIRIRRNTKVFPIFTLQHEIK